MKELINIKKIILTVISLVLILMLIYIVFYFSQDASTIETGLSFTPSIP